MYKQQAKSSHNGTMPMDHARRSSSDSDHRNAPQLTAEQVRVRVWGSGGLRMDPPSVNGGADQHSLSHPRGHGDFFVPSW